MKVLNKISRVSDSPVILFFSYFPGKLQNLSFKYLKSAFVIFLFLLLQSVYSDEGTTTRLSWAPVPYVSKYEVIVQRMNEDGNYVEVEKTPSVEPFIDYTLAPGKYRYQIITYNLRQKPSTRSDYLEFEIVKKIPVEIESITEQIDDVDKYIVIDNFIETDEENKKQRFLEIYAAFQYAPLIPISKGDHNESFFVDGFQPKNAALKIDFIPLHIKILKLGFELNTSFGSISTDASGGTLIGINTGIIVQFPIKTKIFINLRGGAGGSIAYILSYKSEDAAEVNNRSIQMHGGISFQYLFWQQLFFDIGLEYRHIFLSNNTYLSFISPSISIGKRW